MKKSFSLAALVLLSCAGATSLNAQAVKWHPGHYLRLNVGGSQAEHFRHMDEIGNVAPIKGVRLQIYWSELEKSKGSYDFSRIDAYLNKLKSLPTPKRLVVFVMDRRFSNSKTGIVPSYLLTDPAYNGGVTRTNDNGYVARLWETPVMDRLIALYRAMGARYDADTYLEGFSTGETVLSLAKSSWPAGYSKDGLLKQYLRLVSAAKESMPRTNLFLGANYIGTDTQMGTLLQAAFDAQAGAGGPGVMPNKLTQGQRVWIGQTGADYRGGIAIGAAVEALALGGAKGSYTPKQIADHAYNTLYVDHLFWIRNSWNGTPAQQWSTGILPFLKTNPPIRTACPLSYGLCSSN